MEPQYVHITSLQMTVRAHFNACLDKYIVVILIGIVPSALCVVPRSLISVILQDRSSLPLINESKDGVSSGTSGCAASLGRTLENYEVSVTIPDLSSTAKLRVCVSTFQQQTNESCVTSPFLINEGKVLFCCMNLVPSQCLR